MVGAGLGVVASGLTKREMFAMAAMQGLLANRAVVEQMAVSADKAKKEAKMDSREDGLTMEQIFDLGITTRAVGAADTLLEVLEK